MMTQEWPSLAAGPGGGGGGGGYDEHKSVGGIRAEGSLHARLPRNHLTHTIPSAIVTTSLMTDWGPEQRGTSPGPHGE